MSEITVPKFFNKMTRANAFGRYQLVTCRLRFGQNISYISSDGFVIPTNTRTSYFEIKNRTFATVNEFKKNLVIL